MSIIKAGTYRFDDVLSAQDGDRFEQAISFYIDYSNSEIVEGVTVRFYGSHICLYWDDYASDFNWLIAELTEIDPSEIEVNGVVYNVADYLDLEIPGQLHCYKNGWNNGHVGQTITITEDTEVSDEFYTWFTANARNTAGIDFSTLQGLTIPEGVVTQITDASGRVIWSAVPAFDGTIILRPSADISVDSTITLVPEGATAAYTLINEEVSDGAATEIKISSSSTVSGTATFSLAGKTPNTISRVTNIRLCVSGLNVNTHKLCTKLAYVSVNGTKYQYRLSDQTDYEVTEPQPISSTIEDMLAEINDYVATNSVLPNFELSFEFYVEPEESGGKDTMTMSISQAYVVIECE